MLHVCSCFQSLTTLRFYSQTHLFEHTFPYSRVWRITLVYSHPRLFEHIFFLIPVHKEDKALQYQHLHNVQAAAPFGISYFLDNFLNTTGNGTLGVQIRHFRKQAQNKFFGSPRQITRICSRNFRPPRILCTPIFKGWFWIYLCSSYFTHHRIVHLCLISWRFAGNLNSYALARFQ